MSNPCLHLINASGRELRVVRYALSVDNSTWAVEFGPQLSLGDAGYRSFRNWCQKTYPTEVLVHFISDGASRYYLPIGQELASLEIEPVDAQLRDEEISDPQVPKKACLCEEIWWICNVDNNVDCGNEVDPCDGVKILPFGGGKAGAG